MTEELRKLTQLELKLVKVNNTTIPSYAVIPISSNFTQNSENMPYMSPKNTVGQTVSTNVTANIMNHHKLNAKLCYIHTKDIENSNKTTETTTDINLDNYNEHTIDAFNNNEANDEFKVFNQITESNMQHDNLTNIAEHYDSYKPISLSEAHSNTRQNRSVLINLEEKIMQDGLQNAIAHISEGTHFTSEMKLYKNLSTTSPDVFVNRSNVEKVNDNNVLYTNRIPSHTVSDIINSSNKTRLFERESEMETLTYTNDATLQQESFNAISSHDLCADVVTSAQSEAVELAIATEEELPSSWIDVTALATASALKTQSCSEFNAFPTAVHSLVDLVGPEPYPLETESQLSSTENFKNIDTLNMEHIPINNEVIQYQKIVNYEQKTNIKNKKDRNILQEITADADICKCIDCKCDNLQNCQNCTNSSVVEVPKKDTIKIVDNFVSSLQNRCSCNVQSGDCNSCCVVICLKTLQQIRKVFSNCCKNTSDATDICCREKLLPSLMKYQLAKNQ